MTTSNENTIESNFKDLFWELMPDKGFDVTGFGNIDQNFKKIFFYRNENYELRCRLEANVGDDIKTRLQLNPPKNRPDPGVLFFGDNLIAQLYGLTAEIKGFRFDKMDANQDPCFIEGDTYQVLLTSKKTSEEVEFINFWYLNGFKQGSPFCRASENEFKTTLKFKVDGIEKEIERTTAGGISIDCMRLSVNNKTFIFGHVNESFSGNTPCSYLRFSKENLPSKDELEIIENSLSFIFGKIFMYVGYSKYNSNWQLIERLFQGPYMYDTDLEKLIKLPCYEPFVIHRVKLGDSEVVVNQILAKYSELVKIFPLNEVIEAINMFRLFPFDFKIMPLSVALDMIKDAWFKSDKSPSKGKNLEDSNYKTVIQKFLDLIQADLKHFFTLGRGEDAKAEVRDTTTPIINRIKRANNLSNNERIQEFFGELGLTVSELEVRALQTRNIVVHGATKERNDQQFIDNVHIYYTLLNRIILKLLLYDGYYLDYGSRGCPQRHMTLPIKAPN